MPARRRDGVDPARHPRRRRRSDHRRRTARPRSSTTATTHAPRRIEGERSLVDSLVLTPTGRLFVSLCCEPVAGGVRRGRRRAARRHVRYDHALALSPDGTELAAIGFATVDKRPLDGDGVVSAGGEAGDRTPYDVAWLGADRLAVLEQGRRRARLARAAPARCSTPTRRVGHRAVGGDQHGHQRRLAVARRDARPMVDPRPRPRGRCRPGSWPTTRRRWSAARPRTSPLPAPAIDAWHSRRRDRCGSTSTAACTSATPSCRGTYMWARPAGR